MFSEKYEKSESIFQTCISIPFQWILFFLLIAITFRVIFFPTFSRSFHCWQGSWSKILPSLSKNMFPHSRAPSIVLESMYSAPPSVIAPSCNVWPPCDAMHCVTDTVYTVWTHSYVSVLLWSVLTPPGFYYMTCIILNIKVEIRQAHYFFL